jgi:hypothetical protein
MKTGDRVSAGADAANEDYRMNRRELVLLLCGAMTVARPLRAQQKTMPVIGYLHYASPGPNAAIVAAFRQGLSETGYVEEQNVAVNFRWADDDAARLPALAAELVRANVEVIVTTGGPQPPRPRCGRPPQSRSSRRAQAASSSISTGRRAI